MPKKWPGAKNRPDAKGRLSGRKSPLSRRKSSIDKGNNGRLGRPELVGSGRRGRGKGPISVNELLQSTAFRSSPFVSTPSRRAIRREAQSAPGFRRDSFEEADISSITGHAIAQLTASVEGASLEDAFVTPKKSRRFEGNRSPKTKPPLLSVLLPTPEIEAVLDQPHTPTPFKATKLPCSPQTPRPEIEAVSVELEVEPERGDDDFDDCASEVSVISNASGAGSDDFDSDYDDDSPQWPVYLLTKISNLLKEAKAGSMLVFDIDETLIVTRNAPSYLLTTEGVQAFQKFVHKRIENWNEKNQLCRKLQAALKDKIAVEEDTVEVILQLQAMGCTVVGLTARYREMAYATEISLKSVGIDFTRTSGLPPYPVRDPHTDAFAVNGVIYCSNQDKGIIFNRFIESLFFKDALGVARGGEGAAAESEQPKLPGELFFVDDIYENAKSVCAGISPVVSDELGITVSCYHYVPSSLAELQADEGDDGDLKKAVLQKQMEVFADEARVLTNPMARMLIKG